MNNSLALITGASRGIGAATAVLLAKEGYDIALNYLSNDSAAKEIAAKIENHGQKAYLFKADMADESAAIAIFKEIDGLPATLTALVNNVGVLFEQKALVDMDVERVRKTLETNVLSTFIASREAVKRMAYSKGGVGGAIVNVSSAAARIGSPFEYVDYAASKGAIDSMTIGLAKEVADDGIRVNAVRPGLIYTDIHASGGEKNRVERLKSTVPMQRGGRADEVAEAIIWLLSDKSSYCTATFIDPSGGRI